LSDHSFTSKYRPWTLAASFETGPDRGVARKIENHIKKQKNKQYIEDLIGRGSIDVLLNRFKSVG